MSPRAPDLVLATEEDVATCGDAGGITKTGAPCAAFRNLSSTTGLCLWHDPSRGDERAVCARRGGEGSRRRVEESKAKPPSYAPDTLAHLAAWHQWAADSVATGKLPARTADSVCRHLKELRPVLLNLNLEHRLKELEVELKAAKKELAVRKRRSG